MPNKVKESTPPYGQPQNLVKQTCRTLGITQKELAERIGAAEATVRNWSAGKDIPNWAEKSMALLVREEKNIEIITTIKKLNMLLRDI